MTVRNLGTVVVHLKDGRAIDISDRTPADAVAYLQGLGVRLEDIDRTVHTIPRGVVPPRTSQEA